jgi:single-stranded-DNA-specific exonuclease
MERVLAARGFADAQAQKEHLEPEFGALYSPLLFKQMSPAVARILRAREQAERVAIIGDYDADGITASALLFRLFRALDMPAPLIYLPHRLYDGYGLTPNLVTRAYQDGANLIITVDTGITGVEAAALARDKGIDLIITDHHQVIGEIPLCLALIDPWLPGETYPFKELSGVGVAYKLAAAVLAQVLPAAEAERFLKWSFDLTALGTIADLVPLVGENRVFARLGLKVLERPQAPGLQALLRVARVTSLDAETVSFRLAPRINAAGRVADPQLALDLLIEEDEEKCMYLARELDRLNSERQSLVSAAMREIDKSVPMRNHKERLIIVKSSSWQHGIVGLIAGKLTERSLLPVIAMSNNHDPEVYVASCRSRPGYNVTEFIDHFRDMFLRGGGHAAAGGFSIGRDRLALFEESAHSWASEHWRETDPAEYMPLDIDCGISGTECTYTNALELQRLAPFGIGNPEPVFSMSGAQVENVRILGEQRQHRQMRVRAPDQSSLDTITFNIGADAQTFRQGEIVSFAGALRANTFGGQKRAQLVLLDLRKGVMG